MVHDPIYRHAKHLVDALKHGGNNASPLPPSPPSAPLATVSKTGEESRMKKRKVNASKATEQAKSPEQVQQKIRLRAYELYEQRGSQHGGDFDDWLTAEAEVDGNSNKGSPLNGS